MSTLEIQSHDGQNFKAYTVLPKQTPAPALILIQEIFGVNEEMRQKCHEYAEQGYVAICPDLFWRIEPGIELVDSVPAQLERAFELFGEFNVDNGLNDLASTLNFIRGHDKTSDKAGCIGYCLGGKLAYMMATQTDVNASVSYYGVGIENMLDDAENLSHPLLMHVAEEDEFVPPEAQSKIKECLLDHPLVEIYTYPGADHAFARDDGMHFKQDAAEQANARTKEFLTKALLTV